MRNLILWTMLVLLALAPMSRAYAEESCGPKSGLCWPVVKRGATGPRVTALQFLLRERGYKIATDGRFGYTTESALRKFQKKNKLQVDGKIGWQSWEALTPSLKRGARGNAVRALQSLLGQGAGKVVRDGIFGGATEKALISFATKAEDPGFDSNVDDYEWCFLSGGFAVQGC